jgi:hypothetical protein
MSLRMIRTSEFGTSHRFVATHRFGRFSNRPVWVKHFQAIHRFSNRPVWVKHFQAIHRFSVDVTRGLVLLFGIGTKAVPSWDPRTRRYNLLGGLTVN